MGLKLVFKLPFHDYFHERVTQDQSCAQLAMSSGMFGSQGQKVGDPAKPGITPEEWEAVNIYLAFAFVKI